MNTAQLTIQKALIVCNLAVTNRECDDYIAAGLITVNDTLATKDTVITENDFWNGECEIFRGKNTYATLTIDQWLELTA